jgi:hypothetical protein
MPSSSTGEAELRHATLLAALQEAVLNAPAHTDPGLRSAAASGGALAEPVATYVDKVRDQSYRITEGDIRRLTTTGLSEDEIFEITVAAAASRRPVTMRTAKAAQTPRAACPRSSWAGRVTRPRG